MMIQPTSSSLFAEIIAATCALISLLVVVGLCSWQAL
jgi:hypothetical protein